MNSFLEFRLTKLLIIIDKDRHIMNVIHKCQQNLTHYITLDSIEGNKSENYFSNIEFHRHNKTH